MTARVRRGGESQGAKFSRRELLLMWIVGFVGPAIVRTLGATWRTRVVNYEAVERVHAGGRAVVHAFWHGHILPLEYVHRGRRVFVLSSWHRDGEMSARLMTGLGYGVERGSTSRGSVRGLLKMIARARSGYDLAITPDGPRGPARRAQTGILYLAAKSGGVIIPAAVAVDRYRRLSSWDGFLIPLPFSRVVVVHGEPFEPVDPDPGAGQTRRAGSGDVEGGVWARSGIQALQRACDSSVVDCTTLVRLHSIDGTRGVAGEAWEDPEDPFRLALDSRRVRGRDNGGSSFRACSRLPRRARCRDGGDPDRCRGCSVASR